MEKIWTLQKDETYSVSGDIEVSNVYLSYFRDGVWSTPYVVYKRDDAEKIILEAIAKGQAKAKAYRLTPAKDAEKILEGKRQRMAAVRASIGKKPAKQEPDWVENFPVGQEQKEGVDGNENPNEVKPEEEKEMAKVKKASKAEAAEKVGGLFREGTALAYLYEVFEDQKPHNEKKVLGEVEKKFTSKDAKAKDRQLQAQWRLRRFREKGEETGQFALIRDAEEGTLQLKFGKAGAKKAASKPAKKEEKPAKKSEKKSEAAPKTGKAAKIAASLVRRTLATEAGSWTKNKLIEHLGKKFQVAEEDVRSAIKSELKVGGITEEDGVYELA